MGIYKQFVYVYVRAPLLFELVLVLSVSAQRLVCVGSKHTGIMGDEVKGQGQEHTTVCIVCKYLCVSEDWWNGLVREGAAHGSSGVWWKVFTRNID